MLKEKIDEKTLNQTKNSKNKNKIYESINKNIIGCLAVFVISITGVSTWIINDVNKKVENSVTQTDIDYIKKINQFSKNENEILSAFKNYQYTNEDYQKDLNEFNDFYDKYYNQKMQFIKDYQIQSTPNYNTNFKKSDLKNQVIFDYSLYRKNKTNNVSANMDDYLKYRVNEKENFNIKMALAKTRNEREEEELKRTKQNNKTEQEKTEDTNKSISLVVDNSMIASNIKQQLSNNILNIKAKNDLSVFPESNTASKNMYLAGLILDRWDSQQESLEKTIPELKVVKQNYLNKSKEKGVIVSEMADILKKEADKEIEKNDYNYFKTLSFYDSIFKDFASNRNQLNFENQWGGYRKFLIINLLSFNSIKLADKDETIKNMFDYKLYENDDYLNDDYFIKYDQSGLSYSSNIFKMNN